MIEYRYDTQHLIEGTDLDEDAFIYIIEKKSVRYKIKVIRSVLTGLIKNGDFERHINRVRRA